MTSLAAALPPAAAVLPAAPQLLLALLVVAALVALNGLLVAAEFAIIGVRPTQMEELAGQGNAVARSVLAVLEQPRLQDEYIATAQLGITIASLGLGVYSEPQLADFAAAYLQLLPDMPVAAAQTAGHVLSLALLTYLHIVLGEMVPKALALENPRTMALNVARPMQALRVLLLWPTRTLNAIGAWLLRAVGVPPASGHASLHSTEELEQIVAESKQGGLLRESEEEILLNIFNFSERQVNQVMTPRIKIQGIPATMPLAEILNLVTTSRFSRFPVYEGDIDSVIGVLHVRDLAHHRLRARGDAFDIRLLMRAAPMVPESYSVGKLMAAFKRQRLHMALVVDEFGGTAGLVTLEDLVEQVVGEVRDEFDQEHEPLTELAPGVLELNGNCLVQELQDYADLGEAGTLPEVETVGGLMITWLGRPAQVGDRYTHKDTVHFSVLAVDGLAVARVRVEFPAPARPAPAAGHA